MSSTFGKRLAAGVTTALVGSLAVTAVALADGATDNVSRMSGSFTPPLQDASDPGAGSLFVQVETTDADGDNQVPAVPNLGPFAVAEHEAEQVYIDFDDDFVFKINSKLDQCPLDDIATLNTEDAIEECPDAVVGTGTAHAQLGPSPAASATFVVTAFNGETTIEGGECETGDDDGGPPGCEFEGGNPQILLHARNDGLTTTVMTQGELVESPDVTADYGQRLSVTDAPDVNDGAGSLNLFGTQVTKKYTNGKTGKKKKTYQYVAASCGDDGVSNGSTEWDFKTTWAYDDETEDTDTQKNDCAQK